MQNQNPSMEITTKARWGMLFVLVVLPFMATLDSSVVNVALPTMAAEFGVSSGAIAWIVSSYAIMISACILFFGRLGDLAGHVPVFQAGLLVFSAGSLFCGFADTFPLLIAARVMQAIGAGAAMSTNQGLLTSIFPPEERGRALGINAAFVALGTLLGPSLGGLILSFASWEYLFWINVPIGAAGYIAGFFLFPRHRRVPKEERQGKMDYPGAILFLLFIFSLFLGLGQGQSMGFGSPFILACFGTALVTFILFLFVQTNRQHPLLPLGIFREKSFSVAVFCAFTSFVGISVYNIVLPFYLQNVLGMRVGVSGMYMTVYPLLLVLIAPVSGYLSDKIGSEGLTVVGLSLICLGLTGMGTLLGTEATPVRLILLIGMTAAGNGLFTSPNNAMTMSSVPRDKLGIGGSVNALVRNIGMSFGTSLAPALLFGGMSVFLGQHVTGYLPGENEAFLFGMRIAFLAAAGITLVGAVMTMGRLVMGRRAKGGAGS